MSTTNSPFHKRAPTTVDNNSPATPKFTSSVPVSNSSSLLQVEEQGYEEMSEDLSSEITTTSTTNSYFPPANANSAIYPNNSPQTVTNSSRASRHQHIRSFSNFANLSPQQQQTILSQPTQQLQAQHYMAQQQAFYGGYTIPTSATTPRNSSNTQSSTSSDSEKTIGTTISPLQNSQGNNTNPFSNRMASSTSSPVSATHIPQQQQQQQQPLIKPSLEREALFFDEKKYFLDEYSTILEDTKEKDDFIREKVEQFETTVKYEIETVANRAKPLCENPDVQDQAIFYSSMLFDEGNKKKKKKQDKNMRLSLQLNRSGILHITDANTPNSSDTTTPTATTAPGATPRTSHAALPVSTPKHQPQHSKIPSKLPPTPLPQEEELVGEDEEVESDTELEKIEKQQLEKIESKKRDSIRSVQVEEEERLSNIHLVPRHLKACFSTMADNYLVICPYRPPKEISSPVVTVATSPNLSPNTSFARSATKKNVSAQKLDDLDTSLVNSELKFDIDLRNNDSIICSPFKFGKEDTPKLLDTSGKEARENLANAFPREVPFYQIVEKVVTRRNLMTEQKRNKLDILLENFDHKSFQLDQQAHVLFEAKRIWFKAFENPNFNQNIEPLFGTACLFKVKIEGRDADTRMDRISETFRFPLSIMDEQSDESTESTTKKTSCVFHFDNSILNEERDNSTIYVLIKILRKNLGEYNHIISSYYRKPETIKPGIRTTFQKIKPYFALENMYSPFCWTAVKLRSLINQGEVEVNTILYSKNSAMTERELLMTAIQHMTSQNAKTIQGSIYLRAAEIDLPDTRTYASNVSDLVISDGKETQRVREYHFPYSSTELRILRFAHDCTIYPLQFECSNAAAQKYLSSLPLQIEFQLLNHESADPLAAFYSPFQSSELTTSGCTCIMTNRDKQVPASFNDEIKLRLPFPLTRSHHLVMTVYHISKQNKRESLGYALYELFDGKKINIPAEKTAKTNLLLSHHADLGTVQLLFKIHANSTAYPKFSELLDFFNAINKFNDADDENDFPIEKHETEYDSEIEKAVKSIHKIHRSSIAYAPMILNQLFGMIQQANEEKSASSNNVTTTNSITTFKKSFPFETMFILLKKYQTEDPYFLNYYIKCIYKFSHRICIPLMEQACYHLDYSSPVQQHEFMTHFWPYLTLLSKSILLQKIQQVHFSENFYQVLQKFVVITLRELIEKQIGRVPEMVIDLSRQVACFLNLLYEILDRNFVIKLMIQFADSLWRSVTSMKAVTENQTQDDLRLFQTLVVAQFTYFEELFDSPWFYLLTLPRSKNPKELPDEGEEQQQHYSSSFELIGCHFIFSQYLDIMSACLVNPLQPIRLKGIQFLKSYLWHTAQTVTDEKSKWRDANCLHFEMLLKFFDVYKIWKSCCDSKVKTIKSKLKKWTNELNNFITEVESLKQSHARVKNNQSEYLMQHEESAKRMKEVKSNEQQMKHFKATHALILQEFEATLATLEEDARGIKEKASTKAALIEKEKTELNKEQQISSYEKRLVLGCIVHVLSTLDRSTLHSWWKSDSQVTQVERVCLIKIIKECIKVFEYKGEAEWLKTFHSNIAYPGSKSSSFTQQDQLLGAAGLIRKSAEVSKQSFMVNTDDTYSFIQNRKSTDRSISLSLPNTNTSSPNSATSSTTVTTQSESNQSKDKNPKVVTNVFSNLINRAKKKFFHNNTLFQSEGQIAPFELVNRLGTFRNPLASRSGVTDPSFYSSPSQIDLENTTLNDANNSNSAIMDAKKLLLYERMVSFESSIICLNVCIGLIGDEYDDDRYSYYDKDTNSITPLTTSLLKCFHNWLSTNQSERIICIVLNYLKHFFHKHYQYLFISNNDIHLNVGDLFCRDLLYLFDCRSSAMIRFYSASAFYLMIKYSYILHGNMEKARVMTAMSLFSTLKQLQIQYNDQYTDTLSVKESIDLVFKFAVNDSTRIEIGMRAFTEQITSLGERLQLLVENTITVHRAIKDKSIDLYKTEDLLFHISEGYVSNPELRIIWLMQLANFHVEKEKKQYAESADCYLRVLLIVLEVLCKAKSTVIANMPLVEYFFSLRQDFLIAHEQLNKQEETYQKQDRFNHPVIEVPDVPEFTLQGILELLQKAIHYLEASEYFEMAMKLLKLKLAFYEKSQNFEQQSDCYKQLTTIAKKIHASQVDKTKMRFFATYYLITFYGDHYPVEMNGKHYVYKMPKIYKLGSMIKTVNAISRSVLQGTSMEGKDPEIIQSKIYEYDSSLLQPDKIYVKIIPVKPYVEKEKSTALEENLDRNQFYFEQTFVQVPVLANGVLDDFDEDEDLTKKKGNNLAFIHKKKTIVTLQYTIPFVKSRIAVQSVKEILLTPIEVAMEQIRDRNSSLEDCLLEKPTNFQELQMVLQGSVRATVNGGPKDIVTTFLNPSTRHKYDSTLLSKLNSECHRFLSLCQQALKLNATNLGVHNQREFHSELEKGMRETELLFNAHLQK